MPPTIQPPFNGQLDGASITRVKGWTGAVANGIVARGAAQLVPVPLALGLMYAESRGNPNAVSPDRSSYGLMQVNAAVHFAGRDPAELFVPTTNIAKGIDILASVIRAANGNIEEAISRYNGGSGRRQPGGTRFCVMWRQDAPRTNRNIDRDCARVYVTKAGEFGNQPYVDEVLAAMRVFATIATPTPTPTPAPAPTPSPVPTPAPDSPVTGRTIGSGQVTALAVVGALLAWLVSRFK